MVARIRRYKTKRDNSQLFCPIDQMPIEKLSGVGEMIPVPKKRLGYWAYFLLQGKEIVYIGQTVALNSRLGMHTEDKQFNRCFAIKIKHRNRYWAKWIMDDLEQMLVRVFQPRFNIQKYHAMPNGQDQILLAALLRNDFEEIKRIVLARRPGELPR